MRHTMHVGFNAYFHTVISRSEQAICVNFIEGQQSEVPVDAKSTTMDSAGLKFVHYTFGRRITHFISKL